MDNLSRNILTLEREINISTVNPWKIICGSIIAVSLLGAIIIWWYKPSSLKDGDNLSYSRTAQFMIALLVFTTSLLWIFWNLYMFI
jgi:magnesium-transporting ATPase (P-type)